MSKIRDNYPTREDAIAATIKQSAEALKSLQDSNPEMLAAKQQGIAKVTATQMQTIQSSPIWD